METGRKNNKPKPIPEISFIRDEDKMVEEVYDGKGVKFAIWSNNKINYSDQVVISGQRYKPIFNKDVTKNLVLLPSSAEDYGTEEELAKEIEEFIRKWVGVTDEYYKIATWYIMTTWVYDKFDTINYLRALGDTGSGKSRFLETIGGLCYKFT